MKFTLNLWKDDIGTFTQPGCNDFEDALWHVNSARAHDGLCPMELDELKDALRHPGDSCLRAIAILDTPKPYQPKTGAACHCKPGQHRDNYPDCEGTGQRIDFRAIRARSLSGS